MPLDRGCGVSIADSFKSSQCPVNESSVSVNRGCPVRLDILEQPFTPSVYKNAVSVAIEGNVADMVIVFGGGVGYLLFVI